MGEQLRIKFEAWLTHDLSGRTPVVFAAMILLTAVPAVGAAVYLWRLGQGTVERKRILQMLAVVMGVAGVLLAGFLLRLLYLLQHQLV